jgi:hypothetical protein
MRALQYLFSPNNIKQFLYIHRKFSLKGACAYTGHPIKAHAPI